MFNVPLRIDTRSNSVSRYLTELCKKRSSIKFKKYTKEYIDTAKSTVNLSNDPIGYSIEERHDRFH